FIDGGFVEPEDGVAFKTVNPATEEVLAQVARAGPGDVDRAPNARASRATEKTVAPPVGRDDALVTCHCLLAYRVAA
ncbi:MAG: hypothetical protein ACRDQA_29535, partial [Nocardioidaceae bacterium]